MPSVPVVMVIAAAAVLAGVIVVALGRGGELTYFQADYAPIRLDEISATDVVLFRPPMALWGYNSQATDEALNRIADALTERDIEITALRQQVADLEAVSPEARRHAYRSLGRPRRPGSPGSPDAGMPSGFRDAHPAGRLERDVPPPGSGLHPGEVPPPGSGPRSGEVPSPSGPGSRTRDAEPASPPDPDGESAGPRARNAAGDAERFGPGAPGLRPPEEDRR